MPPILPFFAFMLAAPLGVVLLIVNTIALRGALLWREIGLTVLGGILRLPVTFLMLATELPGVPAWLNAYLAVIPIGLSLWCGYKVFVWQSATHELMKYFKSGGQA